MLDGAKHASETISDLGSEVVGNMIGYDYQGDEGTVESREEIKRILTDPEPEDLGAGSVDVLMAILAGKYLDTGATSGKVPDNSIKLPDNSGQTQHIFRDADGHLPDTPENRALLEGVANDSTTTLGTDKWGNTWSAQTMENGTQVWTQTRNGNITNGGLNPEPRVFNPDTGLSSPIKPGS